MHARRSTSVNRLIAAFALILPLTGGMARADQILEIHDASLTAYQYSGRTAVQDASPIVEQRGVNVDGSLRAPWPQGMAINGNPFGGSYNANERLGDLALFTLGYGPTEVDLALPDGLVIGRAFNGLQAGGASDGYQGKNWFQLAQPEIVLYEDGTDNADDVLYIVYGADRFIEFHRSATDATEFRGTNGTAGIVQFATNSTAADTYTYYDQHGNRAVFFGFDGAAGDAAGQIWKYVDTAGEVIYVEHPTDSAAAISGGYDTDGRITTFYDKAGNDGRKYTFTYTALDSVNRLTQVLVETKTAGEWTDTPPTLDTEEVARVDYTYYTSTDNAHGDAGNLKEVAVTMPTSETGVDVVRRMYYRYWKGTWSGGNPGTSNQIKLVVEQEGTRGFDWVTDSVLEYDNPDDPDYWAATDGDLKPYATAYLEYASSGQVSSAWFNGQCGCTGGGGEGTYTVTQDVNSDSKSTGYQSGWEVRTIVEQPDDTWITEYFDETGQSLSRVTTDSDPSGSPTKTWATEVVRNAAGQVIEIHSPESIDGYTHSTGSFTDASSGSVGLVTIYDRVASGDAVGFLEAVMHQEGAADPAPTGDETFYDQWFDYALKDKTIGTLDVTRPMISERRSYHTEGTSAAANYDATTMQFTWQANDAALIPKQIRTNLPAVDDLKNGSTLSVHADQWFDARGRATWSRRPIDDYSDTMIYTKREYNDEGLLSETTVDTSETPEADEWDPGSSMLDEPLGPVLPVRLASAGNDVDLLAAAMTASTAMLQPSIEFDLVTSFTYDAQGRADETTLPDARVTKQYHTALADGRMVTLSIPKVSGSTYYGPVGYTVMNHAGRVEGQGVIAFSGGTTSNAPSTWLDTDFSDPIEAAGEGTGSILSRWSATNYDHSGSRIESTWTYFDIPGSPTYGPGTEGIHYDQTTYEYDDMGRRVAMTDPTGTITRSVLDELGRPVSSWVGTDDAGATPTDPDGSGGTNNMTKVSATEYDGGSDGGNGYVTKTLTDPDGVWTSPNSDVREITYDNDYRGRTILITRPGTPKYTLNEYDNPGRLVATADYKGDGMGDVTASDTPTSRTTDRLTLKETEYDEQGRVFRTTRHNINQGTGTSTDSLDALTWYDEEGRVVKVDGEQLTKTSYDRIGRATNMFTLASDNDPAAGATGTNAAAQTVTGDIVLEEHQTYYENETGNVLMSVAIERHWDDYGTGETTGALDTDTDISLVDASEVVGRVQITAMWYDDLDRPIKTALYGTNGGSDFERDDFADRTSTDPIAIPTASSSDLLLTITTYGDDGDVTIAEDPAGRETHFEYDDAGRRTKVTRNYVDGTPSSATGDDDQVVEYQYTDGLMTAMIADNGPSASQTTTYDYGTTKGAGATDSAVASGRLLFQVIYPEESSGSPSVADRTVTYGYNAQSQRDYQKDQDGNVIETVYDDLGRPITVKLTTIITGYDDTVRRIETAYDDRGMVSTVDQYDATSAGNRLDRISYGYASWAMLTSETIDCDTPARSNMPVSYIYAKATTGRNTIRRTNMSTQFETADAFNLAYNYSSSGGRHDDDASRVTTVQQFSTDLVEYRYNGLGTLITTTYTEPDVFTSLHGSAARTYDRLDQFNRQVSSIWTKDNTSPTADVTFYDTGIVYDVNSNITRTIDNIMTAGASSSTHTFDYVYGIDGLDTLEDATRGNWTTGTTVTSPAQGEIWTLDQLGNWDLYQLDRTGDGDYLDSDELNDDRTHDGVNQLVGRDIDDSGTDNFTLDYDKVGNLIDDGQDYLFVYDPLGRLVRIESRAAFPSPVVSEYRYDGLGRRIAFRHDTDGDASMADEHWYHLAYDDQWRIVAVSRDADESPKEEFAWHNAGLGGRGGSSYIDSVIFRDRDYNTAWSAASDEVLERRNYYVQNWRADVVALLSDLGRQVEHVRYRAYGEPFGIRPLDSNSDGTLSTGEQNEFFTAQLTGTPYHLLYDIDFDGDVNLGDWPSGSTSPLGYGALSTIENRIGYAGYVFDDDITRFALNGRFMFDTLSGRYLRRQMLDAGLPNPYEKFPIPRIVPDPVGPQVPEPGEPGHPFIILPRITPPAIVEPPPKPPVIVAPPEPGGIFDWIGLNLGLFSQGFCFGPFMAGPVPIFVCVAGSIELTGANCDCTSYDGSTKSCSWHSVSFSMSICIRGGGTIGGWDWRLRDKPSREIPGFFDLFGGGFSLGATCPLNDPDECDGLSMSWCPDLSFHAGPCSIGTNVCAFTDWLFNGRGGWPPVSAGCSTDWSLPKACLSIAGSYCSQTGCDQCIVEY